MQNGPPISRSYADTPLCQYFLYTAVSLVVSNHMKAHGGFHSIIGVEHGVKHQRLGSASIRTDNPVANVSPSFGAVNVMYFYNASR